MDNLQVRLSCCGAWNSSSWMIKSDVYPDSCYTPLKLRGRIGAEGASRRTLKLNGCEPLIRAELEEYVQLIVGISITCCIVKAAAFSIVVMNWCGANFI